MGKSIAAERTWPIRLLALAAALAMVAVGLVTASTAATAEEDDEPEARIGNDDEDRDSVDSWGNFIVVDTNQPAAVEGWIREVDFFAERAGTVRFLIIDIYEEGGKNKFDIEAISEPHAVEGSGADTAPFTTHVEEDQYLGVYTEDQGVVSYKRGGEDALWNENGSGKSGLEPTVDDDFTSIADGFANSDRTYSMGATIELPGFGLDEAVVCDDSGCDEITSDSDEKSLSARTDAKPKEGNALLGLRVPDVDEEDEEVAAAVSGACDDMVEDNMYRLGGGIAHLAPVGLTGGHVTLTATISRSEINDAETRGNPFFQVCVAPGDSEEEQEAYGEAGYGGLSEIGETGFVGPILLDDCEDADDTACVESRHRTEGADLVITYRLPTADPMLR